MNFNWRRTGAVSYKLPSHSHLQIKAGRVAVITIMIGAIILVLMTVICPDHPRQLYINRPEWYTALNTTYPITAPVKTGENQVRFRIAVITDLDTTNKVPEKFEWFAFYHKGYLTLDQKTKQVTIEWDADVIKLKSTLSQKGRGMELSELVTYNGKLYSVDDRTGVVYQIYNDRVIPWVILADGDGTESKGFKCEWASVKDGSLYVGGLGKEWTTTTGKLQNLNPQWIKIIGHHGDVLHHDWHRNYNALRAAHGIHYPGYMIHESGVWSNVHHKWFFLPRRASHEHYDETADEKRSTNVMITSDETFSDISVKHIGPLNPTHGFSSFKFIPGTQDSLIVALKSEEDGSKIASYIMVFDLNGNFWFPETKLGDYKYEGFEFI